MPSRRKRFTAVGVTVAAVLAAAVTAVPSAFAATGCQVTYTVTSQWTGGFGATVAIDNLGDPISGWNLTWSFAAGQTVTQLWNGSVTQTGAQVSVTNAAFNGAIGTGGSTSFGFNGSWTGSNPAPASFALNGTTCTGAVATTPPTTTPTSTPPAGATTTAWSGGQFRQDTPNLVRRSNIVLSHVNAANTQFIPFGNGSLGVATWAANGFTAQLNRNDTVPDRKSPGQVVIPGLSKLTGAADFQASLDLYDGTYRARGGGMTMTAYVRADAPDLIVDVTGADPGSTQTAQVKLWSGRSPSAQSSGSVATLAQTWVDGGTNASGQTFGAMAGISAGGRNVTASNPNGTTAQVSFQPNADGSFRVITVAPKWTGGNALTTAAGLITTDLGRTADSHLAWWHNYWNSVGLIKVTSGDGSGEYFETMRTLTLFYLASINRDTVPGTQAGLADLFSFNQDSQPWYPAGYWFWNLRMFVQTALSAGAFDLNAPVFSLYRTNVSNIAAWTSANYPNHQGICVPETMRFNGNGSWYSGNESCDSRIAPSYNSQTVTSGAEIGLWIWQTYLATDDRSFLSANYPVVRDSARFLLSHATTGSDGLLHTSSNAHETQWAVSDPTTDVAAMRALFPVAAKAAQTLGVDTDLVNQLNAAISKLRPFPTTTSGGTTVIANSAQPSAATHNVENIGLEPVWPYNLIGDNGTQTQLARDTFARRPYPNRTDWSFDALHAARLGLGPEMKTAMSDAVAKYQLYPSGLGSLDGTGTNFGPSPYFEQMGVAAAALTEGLVQSYDGLVRAAPAWPSGWDADGTVFIQHNGKAHVQVRGGTVVTFAIDAGATGTITVRNPWPGQNVTVVDGAGATVLTGQTGATIAIAAQAGASYLIQRASAPTTSLPFAAVTGSPATAAKTLGSRTIGIR